MDQFVSGIHTLRRHWALGLSLAILIASALVFAAFGLHVLRGEAFEIRTIGAMILRTGIWALISMVAMRNLGRGSS